jgi:hypothetical protein
VKKALADRDAGVRRAVAMTALADGQASTRRELLLASLEEPDARTRLTMAGALIDADPEGIVPTNALFERTLAGEDDAPLAAMTLAARAEPAHRAQVRALLASSDPILRAHVARGLGQSADPEATGQLADAYRFEADPLARRAIVLALAGRTQDAGAPARLEALRTASRLDPDEPTRDAASRALARLPATPGANARIGIAWLRLTTSTGSAPPSPTFTGALLRLDGLAVPLAFDQDGYALVPIPEGDSRLRLAPRVPAYDAPSP